MRFGQPLVSYLKYIAPIFDLLTTGTDKSTYWFPAWIKKPSVPATNDHAEISKERVMFGNILNLLSIELVAAASQKDPSHIF